ncbi:MAG: ATP synthase F1 subunit gamma [Thermoflexibacter sp.]|jgi:F-type H+-transporting ATPase subunit gamma|nr:ATP synthase F1 subunit gamma [Thermoflexibacter sp.]
MPSLKEVRNRINSVRSTQQITKAMKMVSAAKLRKAQDKSIQMRPYSKRLGDIVTNVLSNSELGNLGTYAQERPVNNVLIIAVTSDRGLCGGFNSNIIKSILSLLNDKYADQHHKGKVSILTIGKKGRDYFKRRNFKLIETYTELFSKLSFDSAKYAAEYAMQSFANHEFDEVVIIYNEFKNVATQIIRQEQMLPLQLSKSNDKQKGANKADYIYEPEKEQIIAELLPKTLKVQLYRSLLESNASEHGARMTAMDKATDNAGELLKELKLTYNRTRQAAITKEILEIVGGAEALANG